MMLELEREREKERENETKEAYESRKKNTKLFFLLVVCCSYSTKNFTFNDANFLLLFEIFS